MTTAKDTFRNGLILAAAFAIAYFIYLSLDILLLLLVAFIIALAIRKPVQALQRRRLPKGLAILIVYGLVLLVIALLLLVILPPIIRQSAPYLQDEDTLIKQIMAAENRLEAEIEARTDLEITLPDEQAVRTTISSAVNQARSRIPALAGNFGSLLSNLALVFVTAMYILLSFDQIIDMILRLFPTQQRGEILQMLEEIEQAVGGYVRGALLVAAIIGVLDFLALTILRIPNAGMLALIVAVTTTVPAIGGYVGVIGATLVALLSSPTDALVTLIVVVVVQQLENYVFSPRIIESTVNLNPVISIMSILIGVAVVGVVGALIAVPVASAVKILIYHLVYKPRIQQAAAESTIQ